MAAEWKADILVVSELNKRSVIGWFVNHSRMVAIGIPVPCRLQVGNVQKGERFVAVRIVKYTVYNCYFSSKRPLDEF